MFIIWHAEFLQREIRLHTEAGVLNLHLRHHGDPGVSFPLCVFLSFLCASAGCTASGSCEKNKDMHPDKLILAEPRFYSASRTSPT